jgi:hypothetical protein
MLYMYIFTLFIKIRFSLNKFKYKTIFYQINTSFMEKKIKCKYTFTVFIYILIFMKHNFQEFKCKDNNMYHNYGI